MVNILAERVSLLTKRLRPEEEDPADASAKEMVKAIEDARREWVTAKCYFDDATEPDLVDYAIYSIEAAEKKYVYLLKQARLSGVKHSKLFGSECLWPTED